MFGLKPKEILEYEKDKKLIDDFLKNKEIYLQNLEKEEIKERLSYLTNLRKKWHFSSVIYNALSYEFSLIEKHLGNLKEKLTKRNLETRTIEIEPLIGEKQWQEQKEILEENHEVNSALQVGNKINLENLLRYYESKGVVGERATCILQTLGAIHKLYFGVESLSGSGKSFVVEALMDLLPKEDVYRMELSSNTAEMYEASEINKKKIIYIPELQKALRSNNPIIVEIIKSLTEGKDISRKVRDHNHNRNLKFTIKGDKGIIYTLAYENQFKKDAELSRRVFQLYTDISEEQTKKILEAIAKQQWDPGAGAMSQEELNQLKQHIKECLDLPPFQYINPFAETIVENMHLNIKSRSFVKHYFHLIQACAKFNHKSRLTLGSKLFVELEDVYIIHKLYGKDFIKTVLRLPMCGEKLLEIFDKIAEGPIREISENEIFRQVRKERIPLNFELVSSSLEELADAGYLEKNGNFYRKVNGYNYENSFDWKKCWQKALNIMREHYPNIADEWRSKQLQENRLVVYDPLQNQQIILFEEVDEEGKEKNGKGK